MSTRIVLIDDHKIFLSGLSELIQKRPDLEVVAAVHESTNAVETIRTLRPDVVLVDIAMPDIDGIKLTQQTVDEFPDLRVICLSMHADAQLIESMFKAGAAAYLLKDCEYPELIAAIDKVSAGETYMSASVQEIITASYRAPAEAASKQADVTLTGREREVLIMIADGLTTKQIAGNLDLSIKTIGTYREHLMDKLDIHSVAGLTKFALREGLTNDD